MYPQSFDSADKFILCATNTAEKIAKIDLVINGLLDMAITAAVTGNFEEYSLDDGQTKIKTTYRNMTDVTAAISSMRKLKMLFVADYNNSTMGRGRQLKDRKNFNG